MTFETFITAWHIVGTVIMVPTIFGNGLILYSVFKFTRLRSNIHVLIANLAVSDFIVGAMLIPIDILTDIFEWKLNKYTCLTVLGIYVLIFGTSSYNLLLISIERFIAVNFPLRSKMILTKVRMAILISFGWIAVSVNTLIPFFGVNTFNESVQCINTNIWPKGYQTYNDWLLLVSVILNFVFYLIVVRLAMIKSRPKRNNMDENALNIHRKSHVDIHNVMTMVIVLGTFMVCWLPYMSLSVAVTFWDTPHLQYVKRFTFVPGLLNSALNWMIYGYRNKQFRKAFKTVLACCFRRKYGSRQIQSSINLDVITRYRS